MKKRMSFFLIILCVVLGTLYALNNTRNKNLIKTADNDAAVRTDGADEEMAVEEEFTYDEDQFFDISLTFAGDVLIAENRDGNRGGGFNGYASNETAEYFLKNTTKYFLSDDMTIVNLENVLSDNPLPTCAKTEPAYWFKSKTANTEILTSSGVDIVSIANNHTRDYGEKGFSDTVAALENAGIEYGHDNKTVYFEKNGYKIALICCYTYNYGKVNSVINRLKEAEAQSDFQIVFFHGGTEGTHEPDKWKIDMCHRLVDEGADSVIGSHPHVLQRAENYCDAEIVYSLGNFAFGGNMSPENRTALYRLTLTVNPNDKTVNKWSEFVPYYVYTGNTNNYQPAEISDIDEANKVIDFMYGNAALPY